MQIAPRTLATSNRRGPIVCAVMLAAACHGQAQTGGAPSAILPGDSAAPALAALPAVAPVRGDPGDIQGGTLLTRLTVILRRDATVGQVNAALALAGATAIVFARPGAPFLTVAVPRQADAAGLLLLARTLGGQPGIQLALAGREAAAKVLPGSADGHAAPLSELDHLLATRFPAAWNAHALAEKDCASRKVTVLVPDFYAGDPPAAFDQQVPGARANFRDTPLEPLSEAGKNLHGYFVAATLAGRFDEVAPAGANPFPACLRLVPVDLSGLDVFQMVASIGAAMELESGNLIVNASIGYQNALCGPGGVGPCASADVNASSAQAFKDALEVRIAAAILWAQFAMQPRVVETALLVVAAGNDADGSQDGVLGELYPGLRDARLSSPFALAVELPDLQTIFADPARWTVPALPSLTLDAPLLESLRQSFAALVSDPVSGANLTLAGSTTSTDLFGDLRRSSFSNDNADLFAVGESVTGVGPTVQRGTSFTAPQIAGLASYLWLLDDSLRDRPVRDTLELIRATSRSNGAVAGVIDAYGAVAALDAREQSRGVRQGLLDANGDGVFDHLDLALFAAAYGLGNPGTPSIPAARDYSRFDLNGDGLSGGITTEGFDLDLGPLAGGAPRFGAVTETIEGYEIGMSEGALSDLQILCYYAYAEDSANPGVPLFYDARPEAITNRTSILGPDQCVEARLSVQLPATISGAQAMTVTVQVPNGSGGFKAAPNALVQLAPTCATANPSSGVTDAAGRFNSTVTPASGCATVSVDVSARGKPGGAVLAHQVVTASAGGGTQFAGQVVRTLDDGAADDHDHWVYTLQLRVAAAADGTLTLVSASGTISRSLSQVERCQDSQGIIHTGSGGQTQADTIGGGQLSFGNFRPLITGTNITGFGLDPANECQPSSTSSTGSNAFLDNQTFSGTQVLQGSTVTSIDFDESLTGGCSIRQLPTGVCNTTGQLSPVP